MPRSDPNLSTPEKGRRPQRQPWTVRGPVCPHCSSPCVRVEGMSRVWRIRTQVPCRGSTKAVPHDVVFECCLSVGLTAEPEPVRDSSGKWLFRESPRPALPSCDGEAHEAACSAQGRTLSQRSPCPPPRLPLALTQLLCQRVSCVVTQVLLSCSPVRKCVTECPLPQGHTKGEADTCIAASSPLVSVCAVLWGTSGVRGWGSQAPTGFSQGQPHRAQWSHQPQSGATNETSLKSALESPSLRAGLCCRGVSGTVTSRLSSGGHISETAAPVTSILEQTCGFHLTSQILISV